MNRDLWKRIVDKGSLLVVALAVFCAVVAVSWGVFQAAEAKSQAQQTRALMQKVRDTQLASAKEIASLNGKLSSVVACQTVAFDAILFDARLAFQGDKNAVDYLKAPDKC